MIDQLVHRRHLLLFGTFFGGFLFGLHFLDLEGVFLEHLDGLDHLADLVRAVLGGNVDLQVTAGQFFHGARHRRHGLSDTAHDEEHQSGGGQKDCRDHSQHHEGFER